MGEATRTYTLGVVTPDPQRDPTSAQLLAVDLPGVRLVPVDTGRLRLGTRTTPRISLERDAGVGVDALVLRRLNPRGSDTVQFDFLDLLQREGVLLVNRPASLLIAESKFTTTGVLAHHGLPVPETVLTQDADDARETLRTWGGGVVKRLYGELGEGVERVSPGEEPDWLDDWLEMDGALYLQRWVSSDGSDLRAFVVGERVVAAMRRIPQAGAWKANIHQGARGEPAELPAATAALAVAAARAVGLDYAGVDLIEGPDGPAILELNGAPGWLGLWEATSADIPRAIVEHVAALLRAA